MSVCHHSHRGVPSSGQGTSCRLVTTGGEPEHPIGAGFKVATCKAVQERIVNEWTGQHRSGEQSLPARDGVYLARAAGRQNNLRREKSLASLWLHAQSIMMKRHPS